MKINFNENKEIWDNFVLKSPHGNIFLYSKFLDSLNKKYELVTCFEDNDEIHAGCVILLDDNDKPLKSVHSFTQYQGLILKDFSSFSNHKKISKEFKITEFFLEELTKKYNNLCLCQSWEFADMRPFLWHNYHEKEKGTFEIALNYTGILDLTKYNSFDDFFMSIRSVRRQEFNKAKHNLQFKWIDDENILDEIHDKTFKRQDIERSTENSKLVKSLTKSALCNGYGKLSAVFQEDKAVSSTLFLYDDETAYYLFGANDPEYRNIFSGNFILLNMIKNAFEQNIKKIDFLGVNSPHRGDYKLSYNAELKPYFIVNY